MQAVKHIIPMHTYRRAVDRDDAFTVLKGMFEKAGNKKIACEVILDGIRCDVHYVGGQLTTASAYTNNPEHGVDVTSLVRNLVAYDIGMPYDLVIRGWLVLPIEELIAGADFYDNPDCTQQCLREAMSPDHPHYTKLEFMMHEYINRSPWLTMRPLMHDLSKVFRIVGGCRMEFGRGLHTDSLKSMLSRINAIRTSSRYDTAGYLYKIGTNTDAEDGYIKNAVYVEERRTTEIYTVSHYEHRVMKSGKISPWATLVDASGEQITCNLTNYDNARRCMQNHGDKVLVDRVGFAVPYVRGLYKVCDWDGDFIVHSVHRCPSCDTQLVKKEEANPWCPNVNCTGRKLALIKYILSKPMMGVVVPSPNYYESIMQAIDALGQPVSVGIFNITASKLPLEVHERIQTNRVMPLYKAVMLLDIPNITMVMAKNLSANRGSLKSIFMSMESVRSTREHTALAEWWSVAENRDLVNQLDCMLHYGYPVANRFQKHVCISGLFDEARSLIIAKLQRLGYGYHVSPNANTDFILVGRRVGDVWEAVKRNDIKVIRDLKVLPTLIKE